MSETDIPQSPPAPKGRRMSVPALAVVFLVLLLIGVLVSVWVFVERVYPIQQQLAAVKDEAASFRARTRASIEGDLKEEVTWDELLAGGAREQVVRIQGLVGLSFQIAEGSSGGTLFLFPPNTTSLDQGPRALLYFAESEPPAPGTLIEVEAWVSRIDVRASVSVISPEQLGMLETSIPAAILIAAWPARILAPPRIDLVKAAASGEPVP